MPWAAPAPSSLGTECVRELRARGLWRDTCLPLGTGMGVPGRGLGSALRSWNGCSRQPVLLLPCSLPCDVSVRDAATQLLEILGARRPGLPPPRRASSRASPARKTSQSWAELCDTPPRPPQAGSCDLPRLGLDVQLVGRRVCWGETLHARPCLPGGGGSRRGDPTSELISRP